MAGIYFITRGHQDHVRKLIENLKSQYFPFKSKKKFIDKDTGKEIESEVITNVEGAIRPIQLWEYVIPDEYVGPMCNTLGIPTSETWLDTGAKEEGTGNSFRSGFGVQGYLSALRIMLKAKKLVKDTSLGFWRNPIYKEHVNILGIGWRPDLPIQTALGNHEGL